MTPPSEAATGHAVILLTVGFTSPAPRGAGVVDRAMQL